MSVNSKMTEIANKIRSLLGITGKLGLDAMSTNLETANEEVTTQEELMERIIDALEGKSVGVGTAKEEQEKSVDITENGTTEVLPDEGKVLSKVTVNTNVASGGGVDYLEKRITLTPYDYYNDKITALGMYAFYEDRSIQNLNLPNVVSCDVNSFGSRSLLTVKLPSLLEIYDVKNCRALTKADFTQATVVRANAFNGNNSMTILLLRNTSIVTLDNINAFANCYHYNGTVNSTYNPNGLTDGYIYVPRALLSDDDATMDYRRATNWSVYPNQFRALEDYTIDGTITGELDESKI